MKNEDIQPDCVTIAKGKFYDESIFFFFYKVDDPTYNLWFQIGHDLSSTNFYFVNDDINTHIEFMFIV